MKRFTVKKILFHILSLPGLLMVSFTSSGQLLKVGIAGLNHDHVNNIMHQFRNGEVTIVGIAEEDTRLADRYKKNYHLPDSIFYKSVSEMLDHVTPDAVLAYNAIADHLSVVEACAPKKVSVMVEKPLATTVRQAGKMKMLAEKYHIHLLTNYETTWYASNQQLFEMVHVGQKIGSIVKMVVHSGHQGPQEIGCSQDFLKWLTDPVKNGGGAIMDFGCYGANLMTWLMLGKEPIAVTAVIRHLKPDMYRKVDDEATILLEYPGATGIIQASWCWPFGIKDLEVYGQKGYAHAINSETIEERNTASYTPVKIKPPEFRNNLVYLAAVLKGEVKTQNDLSSLENNVTVVKILEAAVKSAKEGKRITMGKE